VTSRNRRSIKLSTVIRSTNFVGDDVRLKVLLENELQLKFAMFVCLRSLCIEDSNVNRCVIVSVYRNEVAIRYVFCYSVK
jgi:hypothetical protein